MDSPFGLAEAVTVVPEPEERWRRGRDGDENERTHKMQAEVMDLLSRLLAPYNYPSGSLPNTRIPSTSARF